MGRIVVGVDGSAASAEALRWAVKEAGPRDWSVSAIAVLSAADHGSEGRQAEARGSGSPEVRAGHVQFVVETVGAAADTIDCQVAAGHVVPGLLRAARGADLLVVGARGHEGFRGLLLGSVSQQCAQHATVPVAIVRAAAPSSSDRIVVGVDGSPTALRALQWAIGEARAHAVPVTVVHAWRPAVLGAIDFAAPVLTPAVLEATARETVATSLAAVDATGIEVDTAIVKGGATKALLAAASDATLVVVGSRGLGGFRGLLLGSVSQQVLNHSPCTVVVVPPPDRATLA